MGATCANKPFAQAAQIDRVEPLGSQRVRDTRPFPAPSLRGSPLRLLVVCPNGTTTHLLPDTGQVVVGRDETCDVILDDLTISRRHVRIDVGAELTLVDLGSANGTSVAGKPVEPETSTPLSLGSVITIGSATIVVQTSSTSGRLRHLRTHSYFEARLEDECARALESGTTFTVGRLSCEPRSTSHVEGALAQWLRPMDVVAAYAPCQYEILFVDMPRARTSALVDRLRAHLDGEGVATNVVLAAFPDDARTPEDLAFALARREEPNASADDDDSPPSLVRMGAMEQLRPFVERVAASAISVIVLGETGVGKEVLARQIHAQSGRARKPFVAVNCAALPDALLESELFGYERGAFTGAVAAKEGVLESADGGTIFLDEVADMPLNVQAKLLRVLEMREVTRLGSLRARAIDVRFIAATNRDIEAEVARGAFREDLYFRLAGMTLVVPPLRERVEEIEPLARTFLKRYAAQSGSAPPRLSGGALGLLHRYAWPGNIRELRNVIERAAVLCTDSTIQVDHLPAEKMGRVLREAPLRPSSPPPPMHDTRPTHPPPPPSLRSQRTRDHRLLDAHAERARIQQALERCGGNQTQAARLLGMSRRTLLNRLEEYDLPRPRK
jgi:two-component system, NtrC family, response regulator AtoC